MAELVHTALTARGATSLVRRALIGETSIDPSSLALRPCDSDVVSFDVFVQRFRNGDAATADGEAVQAVFSPHVAETDGQGFARLTFGDGEADVYGFDDLDSGFMANHITGREAWNILVQAAAASQLVMMPVGCPVSMTDASSFDHLPEVLRSGEVAIVATGSQLLDLIQERIWACPVCFEPVLSTRPYEKWPPDDVAGLEPPYVESLGAPSDEVCPSCGFEFGVDDDLGTAPGVSFSEFRDRWEADGRPLFADGRFMPNLDAQSSSIQNKPVEHTLEIVEVQTDPMLRWKCSCGASSQSRRFHSSEAALDAAQRHLERLDS